MCRRRHCLTRETLSHPADSLSGRADNVWPGRQCLAWHTASLAGQTHPAGRLSDPANNLSDPAKTCHNNNDNNDNDNDNDNGGIAAHCCWIFSCTNPPVWPVGGMVVAVTAFLVFIHHVIVFHGFSLFFDVFNWFWGCHLIEEVISYKMG